MTEVLRMKMAFQGLPPGGEKRRFRRGEFAAVAESGRASGASENGADWHMAKYV